MRKPKYFFSDQTPEESCYTLDYFVDKIAEDHEDEMILVEAVMVKGEGFYYCTQFGEVGESGDGCGSGCVEYKPRNGKSGRCRFSHNTYEHGSRRFRLTVTHNLKTYKREILLEMINEKSNLE